MALNLSLGGIGKLYCDDVLLGEVYYNIKPEPQPGSVLGSIVAVGVELELPGDDTPHRLVLEDGRDIVMTINRTSSVPFSAWSCVAQAGIYTPQHARAYS